MVILDQSPPNRNHDEPRPGLFGLIERAPGDWFELRLPDHSTKRLIYLLMAIRKGSDLCLGVLNDAGLTLTDVRRELIRRELAGDGRG